MAAREEFLNRLAGKLGRERARSAAVPKWTEHPWDHLHRNLDQTELVQQFTQELMKLGGVIVPVKGQAELSGVVQEYLRSESISRLIVWPAGDALGGLEPADVWEQNGLAVTRWSKSGQREALVQAAEMSEAGLVYATAGLSETGTIVLLNRGDRGRLVSLLPNRLLAVVLGSSIKPRITQLLAGMPQYAADYSCVNLITGPSRTSDIEMDLTIGVHGPGRITVFLIEDHL